MKLAMTLLVRDEEDIISDNIDYHLAQGVDFFIVTDNGSLDGTVGILGGYQRRGFLRIIHEPTDNYAQGHWVTRMARMACSEYGADWVINSDADEFWWPQAGDLKTTLAAVDSDAGYVVVPRTNFVPRVSEEGEFFERMQIRERQSLNANLRPLPPKVAHRAFADVEVAQGNHSVTAAGLGPPAPGSPIDILHFPLRTYCHFENKISKGGAAYERNTELPPEQGETWRWLHSEHRAGRLRQYYDSQILSQEQIDEGLTDGSLLLDQRLFRYLSDLRQAEQALRPRIGRFLECFALWRRLRAFRSRA